MKKIISFFIILVITISSAVCVQAESNNDNVEPKILSLSNDIDIINRFPTDMANQIIEKINSGEKVYYAEGTTTPDYLFNNTRSVPTSIWTLPGGSVVFDFDMQYGNTYYSPWLFRATSSCTMRINRTCTYGNDTCQINLKVMDKTTNRAIFDNDLYVYLNGTVLSIPLTQSHDYYLVVTPLTQGSSHVSFLVNGQ
ncbi:MAG TPA: hypothetical protein H9685_08590 [Firmicutes bacterium]|nr:hypothetical protein [Bacillota bacterium]